MNEVKEMVAIHANIEITTDALEAIVKNAKSLTGRNEKGHYRVDTAELVNKMISHFLLAKDFETYVTNPDNVSNVLKS